MYCVKSLQLNVAKPETGYASSDINVEQSFERDNRNRMHDAGKEESASLDFFGIQYCCETAVSVATTVSRTRGSSNGISLYRFEFIQSTRMCCVHTCTCCGR